MFKKVLIANRGAIANRIERTLKKMGIASVAVYTKVDQDSLHVKNADEAICIGTDVVKDSYLNASLILKVAKEHGVDAIHPGYGFLSENAAFARACEEQGIVFIGPTPEQLEAFGLKHRARAIAECSSLTRDGSYSNIGAGRAGSESYWLPNYAEKYSRWRWDWHAHLLSRRRTSRSVCISVPIS